MSYINSSRSYTKELRKNFNYLAAWTPGNEFELGDIGIMKRGIFIRVGNLKSQGVAFKVQQDTRKENLSYSSSGSVSLTTKIAGAVAPPDSTLEVDDAGISVSFSKEKSILFKMKGALTHSISDQIALGNTLIDLFNMGEWDKQWVVITELIVADSGTVLVSGSNNGKIDLKLDAKASVADLDIADASINFVLSFAKDMSTQIVASAGLTPLFRGSKVKRRFFGNPEFYIAEISPIDTEGPSKIPKNELFFEELNEEELDDLESFD